MNGRILYKEICDKIIADIVSGKYKVGEFLPSQNTLCEEYKTSLITIKSALQLAENRGYVERRMGRKAMVVNNFEKEDGSNRILLLYILGKSRESAYRNVKKQQTINLQCYSLWHDQIKQGFMKNIDPKFEVITAAYFADEIVNDYENTLVSQIQKVFILVGVSYLEVLRKMQEKNRQVYIVGKNSQYKCCCVYNNDRESCRKIVNYLISLGHRRIAYIGDSTKNGDFFERYLGYQDALKESGMSVNGYLVRFCNIPTADEGYLNMMSILHAQPLYYLPTVVLCGDDNIAYGAIKAIKDNHYSCPDDISVIGVNNYKQICEDSSPTISSIDKKFELVGAKIAMMINQNMCNNEEYVVKCDLVIRDSLKAKNNKI